MEYEGPVFARADGSLVLTKNGRPYHIPADWTVEMAAVEALIAADALPTPIAEPA